ncbi:MAG: NUDIX hydrolase [Nitrospiraceae bacterium]|nr:NUDIX hydrolase [Nitrospiraceae bacterium]
MGRPVLYRFDFDKGKRESLKLAGVTGKNDKQRILKWGRVPGGDDRPRLTCGDCGFIHYVNPRIVVGVVARWQDRILLARRAINQAWTSARSQTMQRGDSAKRRGNSPRCSIS